MSKLWLRLSRRAGPQHPVSRGERILLRLLDSVRLLILVGVIGILVFGGPQGEWTVYTVTSAIVALALFYGVVHFSNRLRPYLNDIAVGAGIFAFFTAPQSIESSTFYELSAQVVPVLFLALALETRAFQFRSSMTPEERRAAALPAFALLLAGVESFRVLAFNTPEFGAFDLVAAALVTASTSLALTAAIGPTPSRNDT